MPIVIVCPKCASHYRVDERYAGRQVVCRKCGFAMSAPELPREGNAEADVIRYQPRGGPGAAPSSGDSLFGEAPPPSVGPIAGPSAGLLDTQVNPAAPWTPDDAAPVDADSKPIDFFAPPNQESPPIPVAARANDPAENPDALASIEITTAPPAEDTGAPAYVTRRSWLWLYVLGSIVAGLGVAAAIVLPSLEHPIPPALVIVPPPAPQHVAAATSAPSPAPTMSIAPGPAPTAAQLAAMAATQPTVPPFVLTPLVAGAPTANNSIDAGPFYQAPVPSSPAPAAPAPWPSVPTHHAAPIAAISDAPAFSEIADVLPNAIASNPPCLLGVTPGAVATPAAGQVTAVQSVSFQRFDSTTLAPIGAPMILLQDAAAQNLASPDGQFLISLPTAATSVQIWSLPLQKELAAIDLGNGHAPQLLGFYNKEDFAFSVQTPLGPTIELINAANGAKVRSAPMPPLAMNCMTVDAGGVSLAMVGQTPPNTPNSPWKATLLMYDLQYGYWRRLSVGPTGQKTFSPVGMAFSPDGAQLALLCDDGVSAVLRVWDTQLDKLTRTLCFPTLGLSNNSPLADRSIDFFPDNRTLALCGIALIDTATGRLIGRTGIDDAVGQWMLPGDRLLLRSGDPTPHWRLASLSLAKISAATQPAYTAASATTEPSVPIVAPLPDWTVRAHPQPMPPAVPFAAATQPIFTLDGPLAAAIPIGAPQQLGPIFFTSDPLGQALVVHAPDPAAGWRADDPLHQRIERLDLRAGKSLGCFDLPGGVTVLDVSPDSSEALLGAPDDFDSGPLHRLFLWSIDQGKLLSAWRPFAAEPSGAQTIAWARLTDNRHVLTQSGAGALVLWSTRDHLSEWRYGGVLPTPALSPSRQWMTLRADGPLRLFDVSSSHPLGDLETVSDPSAPITDITFCGDGMHCAGAWHGGVAVWGFHTGGIAQNITAAAPLLANPNATDNGSTAPPTALPAVLGFAQSQFLLCNDTLLDRKRNAVVFSYPVSAGRHIAGPDGRQWFVACSSPDQAWLCNAALPTPADASIIAAFVAHPPLLSTGAAVSVKLDLDAASASLPGTPLAQAVTSALAASRLQLGPNPAAVAVIHIARVPTRDRVALQIANASPANGLPAGAWPVIPVEAWQCHATLETSAGAALWDSGTAIIPGGSGAAQASPEDLGSLDPQHLQDLYNRAMVSSVLKWAASVQWPRYLSGDGTVLPVPQRLLAAPPAPISAAPAPVMSNP